MKGSLLNVSGGSGVKTTSMWNAEDLILDLGLDPLLQVMAGKDRFSLDICKNVLLTIPQNVDTILYRQAAMQDVLANTNAVMKMMSLLVECEKRVREKLFWMEHSNTQYVLHESVEALRIYLEYIRSLNDLFSSNLPRFKSDGFRSVFTEMLDIFTPEYIEIISQHLSALSFEDGIHIKSGVSIDLNPVFGSLVQVQAKKRRAIGSIIQLRKDRFTYVLPNNDETSVQELTEIKDAGIKLVASVLRDSTKNIERHFKGLIEELTFYLCAANLYRKMEELGVSYCFPVPLHDSTKLSFSGLVDFGLVLNSSVKAVANSLYSEGSNLIIISGPNRGGKSTFLRSIGVAFVLMSAGLPVPASSFTSYVPGTVYTHFRRGEEKNLTSGKFEEEISRFAQIVSKLRKGDAILMNESFSATDSREASELAFETTDALSRSGVRVFFVTHLLDYVRIVEENIQEGVKFLSAERLPDGTRTFRIVEANEGKQGYAMDLFNRIFGKDTRAYPESMQESSA
ncbi:MAG: hypothetical protein QXV22_04775 [Thermoplasmataceae archaeon]